jgi:large subunit ribosomal protein L35Ae
MHILDSPGCPLLLIVSFILYIPPLFPLALLSLRLYVKGVMTGFKRGLRNQHEHTSLLKIQNVNDKASTNFYMGKRVCFIYKAQTEKKGSKYRTIWGRVTRAHGTRYIYPANTRVVHAVAHVKFKLCIYEHG